MLTVNVWIVSTSSETDFSCNTTPPDEVTFAEAAVVSMFGVSLDGVAVGGMLVGGVAVGGILGWSSALVVSVEGEANSVWGAIGSFATCSIEQKQIEVATK